MNYPYKIKESTSYNLVNKIWSIDKQKMAKIINQNNDSIIIIIID